MRTLIMVLLSLPVLALGQQETGGAQQDPRIDTNVIGAQEAPSVTNIVPWKDKAVEVEKRTPTSFLRDRVLQPLDREVLMREVEYYRMLDQSSEGDDLFLD
jgi:hypothetical protein